MRISYSIKTVDLKKYIKDEASALGFTKTGIAGARYDPESHNKYLEWLRNQYQAGMAYLERGSRKRFDPKIHISGASSVIVCSLNYYTEPLNDPESGYISIYARGEDYHTVMRDKLNELCKKIRDKYGEFENKIFVDTSPISEKTFAARAGIGFVGKNSVVISTEFRLNGFAYKGSFHFLGIVITDLPLEPDEPTEGSCGKCRLCIDACPTGAILENNAIDSRKCISYHNTQSKNKIPKTIATEMRNMVFGCDICQLVCPYNDNPTITSEPRFQPKNCLVNFDIEKAKELTESDFDKLYSDTALSDLGFEQFKRNMAVISRNLNC